MRAEIDPEARMQDANGRCLQAAFRKRYVSRNKTFGSCSISCYTYLYIWYDFTCRSSAVAAGTMEISF